MSGVPVERVYVKDGRCIHRIPPTADGSAPFQEGQEVVASVDWDRRFDHMQQHSAQHLFSAIAEKHGYETTTWSLGEERCNVELVPMDGSNTERKLIPMDKLLAIEREVNAAILKGTPMLPQYATPGSPEYEKIAAKFDGKDEKPDVMRIMSIEGIDWNPCCGTHVQNLTQLQVRKEMIACWVTEEAHELCCFLAAVTASSQRRKCSRSHARVVCRWPAGQPGVLTHVRKPHYATLWIPVADPFTLLAGSSESKR